MVINVEHGDTNPSVGTLLRLSGALGVGLPALVAPPQSELISVTRLGEGVVLWRGESGGAGTLVADGGPPDVMELWDWTLGPGDRKDSEAHVPGTRELLQVLDGAITIGVANQAVTLMAGDAVSIRGDVPHSYCNEGPEKARFSLAVMEPGVGPRPRSEVAHV